MSKEYTGFPIANFRTGFDEALEPWLLPRDAFQVLRNAHLYRGVVEKIPGYTFFCRMSYTQVLSLTGAFDGSNKTFTGLMGAAPSTGGTTVEALINTGITETFTDDGNGVLTSDLGGTGTINYVANSPVPGQPAGYITVTFNTTPSNATIGGVQYNSVRATFQTLATAARPIMGIKPFINANGSQDILIFDNRRLGKVVTLTGAMATLQQSDYAVQEIPHEAQILSVTTGFDGTTGPFTGTLPGPLVPGMVTLKIFNSPNENATLLETISDDGFSRLSGNPGTTGVINYATGAWSITFADDQPATNTMLFSGCVYGNIFTGDFTNFFSTVNYQGNTFITNFVDPPMYYDGMCLKYLNTNLSALPNTVAPYQLNKVLHVAVNRERLLLVSLFVNNSPKLNTIYWSVAGDPLDFTNDEQLEADTSEIIKTFSFINTDMIVRFSNSERVFRYTGDAFSPFRWDLTNVMWRCDAPYSAINYDKWFSSVGKPAIVGSDGVNVKRVDEIIPDFTLNLRIDEQQPVQSIDQNSIAQCYGERFDDFKEGWLCYRSFDLDSTTGVKKSNNVLAFSYLYDTYAVYTFPFSCLGFGRILAEDVWGNNFDEWDEANYTWNSYTQTENALIDLGGDQNGKVYRLGQGNSITDMEGTEIPCLMEVVTKDFNPFVEAGELARFGYVDFLVSSNDSTKFRVQFYKDNQLDANYNSFYQETTLTLTANTQYKVWKRIYVGAVGKSHTMRIYQNTEDFVGESQNQPVRIHAMVPYFKAAGRIFN